MSYRLHPTKNKKLQPGEDRWYQIEWYDGKERGTIVKQFANDNQAQLYDNQLKRAYRPSATTLVAPSLETILPDFLEWYGLHRQPRSLEAWLQGWNNLAPHFGKLKPCQLTPGLIDQYKTHRLAQKAGHKQTTITKRTVAKELANLSAIITFATERTMCDPLTFKIKGFSKKQTRPPQKVIPAPEQIALMLEKTRADVRPLYKLIYYAGLRSEEARTLTAADVDIQTGIIRVTGKGNKQRIVPIAGQLKPILEEVLKGKKPGDILMLSARSKKPYSRNIGRLDGAANRQVSPAISAPIPCGTVLVPTQYIGDWI